MATQLRAAAAAATAAELARAAHLPPGEPATPRLDVLPTPAGARDTETDGGSGYATPADCPIQTALPLTPRVLPLSAAVLARVAATPPVAVQLSGRVRLRGPSITSFAPRSAGARLAWLPSQLPSPPASPSVLCKAAVGLGAALAAAPAASPLPAVPAAPAPEPPAPPAAHHTPSLSSCPAPVVGSKRSYSTVRI